MIYISQYREILFVEILTFCGVDLVSARTVEDWGFLSLTKQCDLLDLFNDKTTCFLWSGTWCADNSINHILMLNKPWKRIVKHWSILENVENLEIQKILRTIFEKMASIGRRYAPLNCPKISNVKCRDVQRYAEKCSEKQRNAEKCKEIQRKAVKSREMCGSLVDQGKH